MSFLKVNIEKRVNTLLFTFLIFIGGCASNEDRFALIKEKFSEYPISNIEIDISSIIDLKTGDFKSITSQDSSLYEIGLGKWPVVSQRNLFIVENLKQIKSIDIHSGKFNGVYSFLGRGPGEYQRIDYFFSRGNSFFIVDKSLFKVIEYDRNWVHVNDYSIENFNTLAANYDVGFHNEKIFYPIANDQKFLLKIQGIGSEEKNTKLIHNRLISIGKKPRLYNEILFSISSYGNIVIMHPNLPFLFIYDEEGELKNIYKINFPGLELIEKNSNSNDGSEVRGGVQSSENSILVNPPPYEIETNKNIRIDNIIVDIIYEDEMVFIYYANRYLNDRFLSIFELKNNKLDYLNSFRMYKGNEDLFTVFDLTYSDGWLYLASQFEKNIIRFNVDDILGK